MARLSWSLDERGGHTGARRGLRRGSSSRPGRAVVDGEHEVDRRPRRCVAADVELDLTEIEHDAVADRAAARPVDERGLLKNCGRPGRLRCRQRSTCPPTPASKAAAGRREGKLRRMFRTLSRTRHVTEAASLRAGGQGPLRSRTPVAFDPRQEPGAGKPHAGICAGGGEQSSSLPRPSRLWTCSTCRSAYLR